MKILDEMIRAVGGYVFWYPFLMSLMWIAGSVTFARTREKKVGPLKKEEVDWPFVSILVPCYNEEDTIAETIANLAKLSYPNYEIVAVNDGSLDETGRILTELAEKYDLLRVVDCKENCGKANALHIAAHAANAEFLLCVDSDALLDDDAPYYLIQHFLKDGERVGAVTGNPRIRNRDTLLSKIQIVEYASIIGSIKRSQRVIGKIMTVSGVIVAFRKKALVSVGLWDRDMITEDIAVSWKLQKQFWDIRYEPRALCWMLVPETLDGLFKQRVRWAQGGQEVVLRHMNVFLDWKQRRIWLIYIEQIMSTIWAVLWVITMLYSIIRSKSVTELFIWFTFSSFAMVFLSVIQLLIALMNDSKYDNVLKYNLWAAWYPSLYWVANVFIVLAAIPRTIKSRIKGGYATWDSPDRGEREVL